MTLSISTRHKQIVSSARMADIDSGNSGTGAGKIKLYPDPRPASGSTPTGNLLCTVTLTHPCGVVNASGLHLTIPSPAQAGASGVIRWARVIDSDDNFIMDGDVRLATDSDVAIADFVIDLAQVYAGSFVNLVSATLAEGG